MLASSFLTVFFASVTDNIAHAMTVGQLPAEYAAITKCILSKQRPTLEGFERGV